jgi:hypothetical protein
MKKRAILFAAAIVVLRIALVNISHDNFKTYKSASRPEEAGADLLRLICQMRAPAPKP